MRQGFSGKHCLTATTSEVITMRTTHELARMKAHTLGAVTAFGDKQFFGDKGQDRDGGIFSKYNTFGNLGSSTRTKYQRTASNNSTALIAKADQFEDDFVAPDNTMSEGGLGNLAYFGSDPSFVRREGGVMASSTTFGNFAGPPAEVAHGTYVARGSLGTLATIAIICIGAKKLKLI